VNRGAARRIHRRAAPAVDPLEMDVVAVVAETHGRAA
jgi:hypothetical protein